MSIKKVLVLNGPNLDMLGTREPEVYGTQTLEDIEKAITDYGKAKKVDITCYQSNGEGGLIKKIHKAKKSFDAIIYNPGAHTHYSYALRDAIASIDKPVIEVHLSDISNREPFRAKSVIAPVCVAQVRGLGLDGYKKALDILVSTKDFHQLGEGYEKRYPAAQVIIGKAEKETDRLNPQDFPGASDLRIKKARTAMKALGANYFFVRDTSNITWLSNFDQVFDSERAHALIIDSKQTYLHTDSRYFDAAVAEGEKKNPEIKVSMEPEAHSAFLADQVHTAKHTACVLAIEDDMPLREYRSLEQTLRQRGSSFLAIKETRNLVLGLRAVKDKGEVSRLKAAQAITDAAFRHIISYMKPGMTERQVQIELEDYMIRHGASGLAFSSIVATGANGASPHSIPGDTVLEEGQCVVMDFGARAYGYCADMTRTVFVGEPDEELRHAYQVLRRANEAVEDQLKPGMTGKEAHELAEKVLAEGGFAGKMGHALGHGVGIDVHEEPRLSPINSAPLEVGNVVTVEPGIYITGRYGMRLEDCGLITENGYEVFSRISHEMVII
ncbi:MAG: type II 3-dehydroquinate dehydratase [Eggerthellaceae bacterium]|jgi:3-dehydroquinate dehydratase type II